MAAEAPVHPLQQSLKDLERAYANFFDKRAASPRFRKKSLSDRVLDPDPKQIRLDQVNSRTKLPKLGWVRYRNSRGREVLGTVKNVTVSLSGGKWFMSIQAEREVQVPLPRGGELGIDPGVSRFATFGRALPECGNLDPIAPSNSFSRHAARLRRARSTYARQESPSFAQRGARGEPVGRMSINTPIPVCRRPLGPGVLGCRRVPR